MLVWLEGFDYTTATGDMKIKYPQTINVTSIQAGRRGGYALYMDSGSANLPKRFFKYNHPTWVIGFNFYCNWSWGTTQPMISFGNDTGTQVRLVTTASPSSSSTTIAFQRNTTTLATSVNTMALNTWYWVELKFTVDSSAGAYEMRVNGTPWITGSSANTQAQADNSCYLLTINGWPRYWYDDLYLLNGSGENKDFLGESIVKCYFPQGNGKTNDFSSSSGNLNYLNVDEVGQNSDTDYNIVSASLTDKTDLYALGSFRTGSLAPIPFPVGTRTVRVTMNIPYSDCWIDGVGLYLNGGTNLVQNGTAEAMSINQYTGWITGLNSNWIAPANLLDNGAGTLTMTRTFDLTGYNLATTTLTGTATCDDAGNIQLNGNTICTIPNFEWTTMNHTINVAGGSPYFNQGLNTLTLNITTNDRNSEAFRMEAVVSGGGGPNIILNTGTKAATWNEADTWDGASSWDTYNRAVKIVTTSLDPFWYYGAVPATVVNCIDYWNNTGGLNRYAPASPSFGSYYFSSGLSTGTAYQDIDVSAYATSIDDATVNGWFEAAFISTNAGTNVANVSLTFKDTNGNTLNQFTIYGPNNSERNGCSGPIFRTIPVGAYSGIPPGTRKIKTIMNFTRDSGSNCEAFLGDIHLYVANSPDLLTNGVCNGTTTGWTQTGDIRIRNPRWDLLPKNVPDTNGIISPFSDGYVFSGGSTSSSSLSQTVDVSAYSSFLDSPIGNITLTFWCGGYASKNDLSTITLEFQTADGTVLRSITTPAYTSAERTNITYLVGKKILFGSNFVYTNTLNIPSTCIGAAATVVGRIDGSLYSSAFKIAINESSRVMYSLPQYFPKSGSSYLLGSLDWAPTIIMQCRPSLSLCSRLGTANSSLGSIYPGATLYPDRNVAAWNASSINSLEFGVTI